ncbi:MAG: ABC transporter ATP-binding protein [Candidatus Omnitrophota bacterium]
MSGRAVIEIRDLNYAYPDGTDALFDINLDILEGESVGLIGPNGAGKSTLLLHLNGILKGSGSIKILSRDMEDKNLSFIRSKVGLVFQDPDNQLFMPTVFDDVAFGPLNMGLGKSEAEAAVITALKEVDMLSSMRRLSHHLSFGEKKRVSIATVLSMQSEILALDEPSSNLDLRHRRQLIELLKSFKHTKVVATHDLSLVSELCPKVILLYKGRVAATGPTRDILENKPLLEAHGF